MSLLNSILAQVGKDASVEKLAAKVGLTPSQVERAVAALGQARSQQGDAVETAAQATGLPADKVSEILDPIGGEGLLGHRFNIERAGRRIGNPVRVPLTFGTAKSRREGVSRGAHS